jgi:hypothetical protein
MANRHFGKIGAVWKHLALAEILAGENPRAYWESHAGCAVPIDALDCAGLRVHFFGKAPTSAHSAELFSRLTLAGVKVLFWYGFASHDEAAEIRSNYSVAGPGIPRAVCCRTCLADWAGTPRC